MSQAPLIIERIQAEGGFLNNLDLELVPGLNVVIGPRGSGKTSLVELIRYCLGTEAMMPDGDPTSAVPPSLKAGEVALEIRVGNERVTIARSAGDPGPRVTRQFRPPLIFSQNEIEGVGLDPTGRLRILDDFSGAPTEVSPRIETLRTEIRSLTAELADSASTLSDLRQAVLDMREVPEQLKAAEEAKAEHAEAIGERAADVERLDVLSAELVGMVSWEGKLSELSDDVQRWHAAIGAAIDRVPQELEWEGEEDRLPNIRDSIGRGLRALRDALKGANEASRLLSTAREETQDRRSAREKEARDLRSSLNDLKSGAGAIEKRISDLRQDLARRQGLIERQDRINAAMTDIRERRATLLLEIEELRSERYERRAEIARRLNRELGGTVQVDVLRGGASPEYVSAIRGALRGSGMWYNTLAPQLAARFTPQELVELVESREYAELADLAGITEERSQRLVAELSGAEAGAILTAKVDDSVTFSLFDQTDFKRTEQLSTGQRCTAVLSILFANRGRALVIDQPEDNLDNAFVAETLIPAIRQGKVESQLILTTHNPNIPVLGEAERVVFLGSTGDRGFVRSAGPLDDPASVSAITTVMEGGREAFRRRAEFYGSTDTGDKP